MSVRPLRFVASATSTLALVAAGVAVTTSSAGADPSDIDTERCAGTPVWTGGFTPDQPVHGMTTTRGITPEAFTGTYVDTLQGAAGRNKDILLFELEGSRITKTDVDGNVVPDAGIWAGMSGSPVYDADDNLIGAVAYGFSYGPSRLAGVTPAKDLLDIQGTSSDIARASIPVPSAISEKAAAGTLSRTDDPADYDRIAQLKLPRVSVGTTGSVGSKFLSQSRQLKKKFRNAVPKFTTGSAATELDPTAAIVAGGNIASAWSHGDVTFASVGTITAICGDQVFAFGHPDSYVGDKTTATFHAASTARIQEDSAGDSYKLVNIDLDPVGQITQDRLSGILGIRGQLPQETTITTNTTLGSDSTQAVSKVSMPEAVASVTASQVFNDVLDGLDSYTGGGEAYASWTINYTPRNGSPAAFTRKQRFSFNSYLAERLPFEIASDVEFLQFGSDQKVTINSVTINNTLQPDHRALRLSKLEYRKSTKVGKKIVQKWIRVSNFQRVPARRGTNLPLRATLTPAGPDSVATPYVRIFSLKISKGAIGQGIASVSGGQSFFPLTDEDDEFIIGIDEEDEEDFYFSESNPPTLAEVLAALKGQVRNDSLITQQQLTNSRGVRQTTTQTLAAPAVTSGQFLVILRYTK